MYFSNPATAHHQGVETVVAQIFDIIIDDVYAILALTCQANINVQTKSYDKMYGYHHTFMAWNVQMFFFCE